MYTSLTYILWLSFCNLYQIFDFMLQNIVLLLSSVLLLHHSLQYFQYLNFVWLKDSDSVEEPDALEKRLRERAIQSIQSKGEIERERQLREKALQSMKNRGGSDSSEEDSD